jgi:hypothetical protein
MFPESCAIAPPIPKHAKHVKWRVATEVSLQTSGLESRLQTIEKGPSEGRAKPVQFIPYRFQFTNRLTKNDRLSLAFDALVLSEAMGCDLSCGNIIHGDGHTTSKVKLSSLDGVTGRPRRNRSLATARVKARLRDGGRPSLMVSFDRSRGLPAPASSRDDHEALCRNRRVSE